MQRKGDIKKYKVSVELSLISVVSVESKLAEMKVGLPCTHGLSAFQLQLVCHSVTFCDCSILLLLSVPQKITCYESSAH